MTVWVSFYLLNYPNSKGKCKCVRGTKLTVFSSTIAILHYASAHEISFRCFRVTGADRLA